jgi:hypothetical protein
VIVRFQCPACEKLYSVELTASQPWQCRNCPQQLTLTVPDLSNGKPLSSCLVCGNGQLYRQKNFPQWLGLSLLAFACASFFVLQLLYEPRWAWGILLGSAALDGLLYYFVGDAIVCYRCHAKHAGLPRHPSYDPFELATGEKYRQEKIRRELAGKK